MWLRQEPNSCFVVANLSMNASQGCVFYTDRGAQVKYEATNSKTASVVIVLLHPVPAASPHGAWRLANWSRIQGGPLKNKHQL